MMAEEKNMEESKMEIKNLKDLKKALSKIPDEELENFGIMMSENGLALCTQNGDDELEMQDYWSKITEEYPELDSIDDWFDKVFEACCSDEPENYCEDFISNKKEE